MYDPTLSLISQYVDGIFSIKDSSDSVYTDALSITSSDSQTVHKILLSYVVNKPNVNNILVFDNLFLIYLYFQILKGESLALSYLEYYFKYGDKVKYDIKIYTFLMSKK